MEIKNPLHGKYAQPMGVQSGPPSGETGTFKAQDTSITMSGDVKTDIKWIKVVGFFTLVLIALYPVVIGVSDIFSPNDMHKSSFRDANMVKIQHKETTEPTFFEKLFCRGARRSSWCGQNGEESSR